jgi:hypothetical protein
MDEHQAIEQVLSRLIERFSDVPPEAVRRMVQDVHSGFDGRVRDYVPILVEREARARLDAFSGPGRTRVSS